MTRIGRIRKAADGVETKAPPLFIPGLKIAAVSWIIGMLGMLEVFAFNTGIGGLIARIAVVSGLCGIGLGFYSLTKYQLRKWQLGNEIKKKYENPKQPWE